MGLIKDLRSVALPGGTLARTFKTSEHRKIKAGGLFQRNQILQCRHITEGTIPTCFVAPGLINRDYQAWPEVLGGLTDSEDDGTVANVIPQGKDMTQGSYWDSMILGSWIAYETRYPVMVRDYTFITENGYTPRVWRVEGSDDGSSWATLHSVTVDWTWGAGRQRVDREIPAENRDYFRFHRIIFDEFDASAVRCYYLQFWNGEVPAVNELQIYADETDPLILSFADGYDENNDPVDHVVTVNTPVSVSVAEELFADTPSGSMMRSLALASDLNMQSGEPSFEIISINNDSQELVQIAKACGWEMLEYSVASGSMKWCDMDWTQNVNYTNLNSGGYVGIMAPLGFSLIVDRIHSCWDQSGTVTVDVTYDGGTWSDNLTSFYVSKNVISNVSVALSSAFRGIRLRHSSYGGDPVEIEMFGSAYPMHKISKLENGKIYEYNPTTEQWDQIHKIWLGVVGLMRNPEDTGWEISSVVPTMLPTITLVPYPRRTAGVVW